MSNEENENEAFIRANDTPKKKIYVLRALSLTDTLLTAKELTIWDKRKWLVLEDYWLNRITVEHTHEQLKEILSQEKVASNDSISVQNLTEHKR